MSLSNAIDTLDYAIDIKQHTRDEIEHAKFQIEFFMERWDSQTVKYIKDRVTEKLKILLIE